MANVRQRGGTHGPSGELNFGALGTQRNHGDFPGHFRGASHVLMVYFHGKVVINNHETWGIQASTMMDEVLQWKVSIESNVSLCVSLWFTVDISNSLQLGEHHLVELSEEENLGKLSHPPSALLRLKCPEISVSVLFSRRVACFHHNFP